MRILDENDKELTEDQLDFTKGYLKYDQIFKEHHDAVEATPEKSHLYPTVFYFSDGTKYVVDTEGEKDPHVKAVDNGIQPFVYVLSKGESPRTQTGCECKHIIDSERQEAKAAYDEMETIQRYKLYTADELKANQDAEQKKETQEEFIDKGPSRLTAVESSVDDMTLTIADLIGA